MATETLCRPVESRRGILSALGQRVAAVRKVVAVHLKTAGIDLALLVAAYTVAVLWPAPAMWLREASLGEVVPFSGRVKLTLQLPLLALLLFNAGLGVPIRQLGLQCVPVVLCTGLAANLLLPLAALFGLSLMLDLWPNHDQVQTLLVGLALVVAMPVAGSSAAWAQKVNGDLSLSLGLVLGSTLLSPLTTPLTLHAAGFMAMEHYAEALHALAASGTGDFLLMGVVLPALLGVLARQLVGENRVTRAKRPLKRVSTVALLLLCYVNAAAALPQFVADPAWDFLTLLLTVVVGLCGLAFAAGWVLARLLKADAAQQRALMFGLGMSNNGTGLVLAGTALTAYPQILLPVILYNLLQHLIAGAVAVRMAGTLHPLPSGQATGPVLDISAG